MKTTKGGKVMNPTDAYRKELRKKELKRNKKERKKVREVGILKKDPETIREQIEKLEMMKADGALDKARKHKKRQLEDTLNLVLKKRKEYEEKLREKGETPVMFSHLGPPRRRTTAEEEERVKHPKPEDSVYYHPTLNPTGAPPPGKPPMYKSSIGPRIPLSAASSSGASSSSSKLDYEDVAIAAPLPPPPPPPAPDTSDLESRNGSALPSSLPLPPPPPMPPKPPTNQGTSLPPPPPGPPPKEQAAVSAPLPPPPMLQRPGQTPPPPPGTTAMEREKSQISTSDDPNGRESELMPEVLPPPPPGLPVNHQSEGAPSKSEPNVSAGSDDGSNLVLPPPPPPPPRQPLPPMPRAALIPNLQPDVLPPGISRLPPPPPPPGPPLAGPGIPGHPAPPGPPGMVVPPIQRPPFGPPPGPPPMMRPPLPSSLVTGQEDGHAAIRPPPPPKPSYIKSAESTVVKRPLAQHTPELTAMVPASVRVRRETVAQKAKPKSQLPTVVAIAPKPAAPTSVGTLQQVNSASVSKPQSIDDSYMAFLEDMKALGALDG